jgi:ABC-type sugar transport system substrate-binding protein
MVKKLLCATAVVSIAALAGLSYGAGQPTIPIIVKDTTSLYWQIALAGARQAGKDLDVAAPELGAQSESDIVGQISILENAVAEKPAAVVIAPSEFKALGKPIDDAAKKTPIVGIDSAADSKAFASLLTTDNAQGGRFARALDLGCGAGLAGAALRARVEQRLDGVDLSPAMLAKAHERGVYDALEAADFVDHLRRFGAAFDLIVAADALAYCGDLQPVFAAAAAALTPGGLFAFTVETFAGEGYRLGETMRFVHARAHVEARAAAAALSPVIVEASAARREKGADAPGLAAVYAR